VAIDITKIQDPEGDDEMAGLRKRFQNQAIFTEDAMYFLSVRGEVVNEELFLRVLRGEGIDLEEADIVEEN
jgi:hypothetical protein